MKGNVAKKYMNTNYVNNWTSSFAPYCQGNLNEISTFHKHSRHYGLSAHLLKQSHLIIELAIFVCTYWDKSPFFGRREREVYQLGLFLNRDRFTCWCPKQPNQLLCKETAGTGCLDKLKYRGDQIFYRLVSLLSKNE